MTTGTAIRDTLVLDVGPVANAGLILARETTLAEHVTVTADAFTTTVTITDDIPFALWGTGTQGLWRLLSSIAYSSERVALREVIVSLDMTNRAAVARAGAALCGVR